MQPNVRRVQESGLVGWWHTLRAVVFSSGLGPYIVIPLAWAMAWLVQWRLPALEFVPSVYLIFFPAGVRTVAVFVYGLRGAIITGASALVTTTHLLDLRGGSLPAVFPTLLVAVFPALFAWLTMVVVCRWRNIPKSLLGLTANHVAVIVLTQALVVVSVKQAIFHEVDLAEIYANASTHDALTRWGAMFIGDVLGSIVGIVGLIVAYTLMTATRDLSRR
jgi:hypothetical protein